MPSIIPFENENEKENEIELKNKAHSLVNINESLAEIIDYYQTPTLQESDRYEDMDEKNQDYTLIYEELIGFNFTQKIDNIYQKVKQNSYKLNLYIDISFSYTSILVNFANSINKIAKYVKYLKWNINSLFAVGKYVYMISDTLALFKNLTKLELVFSSTSSFTHQGVILLFEKIKQFKNLRIFNFNAETSDYVQQQSVLVQTVNQIMKNEVFSETIEQIKSNILNLHSLVNFPNLSTFYCRDYQENIDFNALKSKILQFQNKLTEIVLTDNVINQINILIKSKNKKTVIEFLKLFVDLPYLTKLYNNRQRNTFIQIKNQEIKQFANMILQVNQQKKVKFIKMIAFEKQIKQFMIVNPRFIMADLWYS